MSIYLDQTRNQYLIEYTYNFPDGTSKRFKIRNSQWVKTLGKKYMKSIEEEEIQKDIKKRNLDFIDNTDNNQSITALLNHYQIELQNTFKSETARAKINTLHQYLDTTFNCSNSIYTEMTISSIDNFKNNLISSTDICIKRKNNILRFFREFLTYCSEREYITFEYANKLKVILKGVRDTSIKEDHLTFWNDDELKRFFDTFDKTDKWYYCFKFIFFGALRVGELLPIKVNDLNLDDCSCTINKTIDKGGKLTSTKNVSSTDRVYFNVDFINEMKKYISLMYLKSDDYLFFGANHTSRTTIQRIMDQHAKQAKIKHLKVHGLRHSMATYLFNHDAPIELVSKHLRHSSTQITMNVYVHILPKATKSMISNLRVAF